MTAEVSLREYVERLLDERQKQVDLAAAELRARLGVMSELRDRIDKLERWQAEVMGRQMVFGFAVIVLAGIVSLAIRLVGH